MNIGLLGFGVVGGGVLELTQSRSDIAVSRVLLRSPKAGLPEGLATYDFNDILTDDAIDTVVEVMGGLHPAYEYVSAAMERGKNVVTANKALIAAYYPELTALAREKGVALRCTAAVGGGILHGRVHHGAVAAVNAVKIAERHGTALRGVDRRQALVDLHWLSAPFAK